MACHRTQRQRLTTIARLRPIHVLGQGGSSVTLALVLKESLPTRFSGNLIDKSEFDSYETVWHRCFLHQATAKDAGLPLAVHAIASVTGSSLLARAADVLRQKYRKDTT